jgi:hypothetical protein
VTSSPPMAIAIIERKYIGSTASLTIDEGAYYAQVELDTAAPGEPGFKAIYPGRFWVILQAATSRKDTKLEAIAPARHAGGVAEWKTFEMGQIVSLSYSGGSLSSTFENREIMPHEYVSQSWVVDLAAGETFTARVTQPTPVKAVYQMFIWRLLEYTEDNLQRPNVITRDPQDVSTPPDSVAISKITPVERAWDVTAWRWRLTPNPTATAGKVTFFVNWLDLTLYQTFVPSWPTGHTLNVRVYKSAASAGGGAFDIALRRIATPSVPAAWSQTVNVPTDPTAVEAFTYFLASDPNAPDWQIQLTNMAAADACEIEVELNVKY